MDKKDIRMIVKTAVALFLICAVCAGAVAAVNAVTEKTIETNAQKTADEAKSAVLSAAVTFEDVVLEGKTVGWAGKNDAGETVGYVFSTSASGYGGTIEVMTGFDAAGAVTGVQILSIEETPGLGMNAKRESWLSQFTGKTGVLFTKGQTGEDEIQAITSATITSKAMVKAVNAARDLFNKATAGEGA